MIDHSRTALLTSLLLGLATLLVAPTARAGAPPPDCEIGSSPKLPAPGTPCRIVDPREVKLVIEASRGAENTWSGAFSLRENRFAISDEDRKLRVICLRDADDDGACLSTISETARETAFVDGLKKVVGALTGAGAGLAPSAPGSVIEVFTKCLYLEPAFHSRRAIFG